MVPLTLFANRAFSGANMLTFTLYFGLSAMLFYLPMTVIGGWGVTEAALEADESVKIYKQYVDLVGLGYDVKAIQNTTLPAFTGSVTMKHAHVQP